MTQMFCFAYLTPFHNCNFILKSSVTNLPPLRNLTLWSLPFFQVRRRAALQVSAVVICLLQNPQEEEIIAAVHESAAAGNSTFLQERLLGKASNEPN